VRAASSLLVPSETDRRMRTGPHYTNDRRLLFVFMAHFIVVTITTILTDQFGGPGTAVCRSCVFVCL